MMDYGFTEYQTAIRDLAREIADKEIRPVAAEYDREGKFPWPIVKVLAETDLFRVFLDDQFGGLTEGTPIMNMVIVTEELSKACGGIALSFAGTALGAIPIVLAGSAEQKQRWLPDIAAGKKLAAFALTEPQAGSDAAAVRTTALRDGDHYVLKAPSSGSPTAAKPRFTASSPSPIRPKGRAARHALWWRKELRDSLSVRRKTSSAFALQPRANWSSRIAACRWKIAWDARAPASSPP